MISTLVSVAAAVLGVLTIAGCGANGPADATAPAGVFEPLPGAPPAFAGVSGRAQLTNRPHGGSDVSLRLAGLKPNTAYISHLHVGDCDQPDPGGPHFKFDLDGPDAPPNEIHLNFASNATGHASTTTHSTRRVPAGTVRSIVVHAPAHSASAQAHSTTQTTGAGPGAADVGAGHLHQHLAEHGGGPDSDATASGAADHTHDTKIACAALRPPGAHLGSP